MEIITATAEKDDKGRRKILVEVNEFDVVLLNQTLKEFTTDDTQQALLNHNKEQWHKAFTIVRPS